MESNLESFWQRVLREPSYGYSRLGSTYSPRPLEVWPEALRACNIFSSKKNWMGAFVFGQSFFGLAYVLATLLTFDFIQFFACLALFTFYFGPMAEVVWHRGMVHRSFKYSNPFLYWVTRLFLVVRDWPYETVVVSHHVHHFFSDKPGDPYNARSGWLPLFLSDLVSHRISPTLKLNDYQKVVALLQGIVLRPNSFEQYKKWGSVTHPFEYLAELCINYGFWALVTYQIGGSVLTAHFFAAAFIYQLVMIRGILNFFGHGAGKDRRRPGIEFVTEDISYNHPLLIFGIGHYHSNHHFLPKSARTAFLPGQFDIGFTWLRILKAVGIVRWYFDGQSLFNQLAAMKAKVNLNTTSRPEDLKPSSSNSLSTPL